MDGVIQPPPVKIVAKGAHHLQGELALFVHVKMLVNTEIIDAVGMFADGVQQFDQGGLVLVENRLHLARFQVTVKFGQQGIIGMIVAAAQLGFLKLHGDDALQRGLELLKIFVGTRLNPGSGGCAR